MSHAESSSGFDSWTVRSIVGTMFPLLLVLSVLEIGSGYVLETLEATYVGNPTLLVLVPVMIGMGGNLGSILSSRLSTQLHLGLLTFDVKDEVLWTNVVAVFALAGTIFPLLGAFAWIVGLVLTANPLPFGVVFFIAVVSGLVLALVAVVLGVLATYVSYTRGLDPDDTTIPVVTNVCDILGVVILSGVAILVL